KLPFPPLTKRHIINCSFHSWHPKYRSVTPKARLVPLTPPFLEYLRADGILLPPDDDTQTHTNGDWSDTDSGIFSSNEDGASESSEEDEDPSAEWRDVHQAIKATISELGGKVVPKLNWSAPKDATWISATNTMECQMPNDIYLLLKSSDFVTHDLEHAFDGCEDDEQIDIPYHLVLRKHVLMHVSLEFRCFVRKRRIIGTCQRDLNHYDFLFKDNMQEKLRRVIQNFFDDKLRATFPDENFAFDVYIPPPHNRVWLVDINPWARRTDPLLFSWMELLNMPELISHVAEDSKDNEEDASAEDDYDDDSADEELDFKPEFRVVRRNDPEAYAFNSPQYSAHKMPRDVVDASQKGGGVLREFAEEWKEALARQQSRAQDSSDD
ncbi:cell cycle control protein Cdc123, partial [Rhizodiscina lignyota]